MSESTITRRQFCAAAVAAGVLPAYLRGDDASQMKSDVDWLDEIQRPPADPPPEAPRLSRLLVDREGHPIRTVEAWRERRRELLDAWSEFLGPMPGDTAKVPETELLGEDRDAGVLRQWIRYEAEEGEPVEAYLLRPLDKPERPRPGVVVLHSTVQHSIRQPAGLEGQPEKAFGLRLARRGYVTLCPRNYLWPDTNRIDAQNQARRFLERHPQSKGMTRMLFDAIVATNILAAQPGVDSERLGSVGHSLGAKEVLYLAAFDDRIQVTVSSEGGIGPTFSNWDAPWYLGETIKQPEFARDHHELLAAVAPRAFLLIGGDSADGDRSWPYVESVLPVYRLFGNSARVGLFNHKQGHAVPPVAQQRIDEWFETYHLASVGG